MREYKRVGGVLWLLAAAIGVVNVYMNLVLLRDLLLGGLWAYFTLLAAALGVFSLIVPLATASDTEISVKLALARPRRTIPWDSISSWRLEQRGQGRLVIDLDGGRTLRIPLSAVRKDQRDSLVQEFRQWAGAKHQETRAS